MFAAQVNNRYNKAEKDRTALIKMKRLAFIPYNTALSQRLRRHESWSDILTALETEFANTEYNHMVASVGGHKPNDKYKHFTVQTTIDVLDQLIMYRRTRHRCTDAHLTTLSKLVVLIEKQADIMHNHHDKLKYVLPRYKYLRVVVDNFIRKLKSNKANAAKAAEKMKESELLDADDEVITRDVVEKKIERVRQKKAELKNMPSPSLTPVAAAEPIKSATPHIVLPADPLAETKPLHEKTVHQIAALQRAIEAIEAKKVLTKRQKDALTHSQVHFTSAEPTMRNRNVRRANTQETNTDETDTPTPVAPAKPLRTRPFTKRTSTQRRFAR